MAREELQLHEVPFHVAIIMDGNGRWAKKRGLPRVAGHKAGMERVKEITTACQEVGVQYLTLFAFSTENWRRPKDEVNFLMGLPGEFLRRDLRELIDKNVKLHLIGDEQALPAGTRQAIMRGLRDTCENTGMVLSFALNYGGRADIIRAVSQMTQQILDGKRGIETITEEDFQNFLYTSSIPDPDLLIRTSGEQRISNFMLWQLAYAELYFTDVYWPDFGRADLEQAIDVYQHRVRRYGKV